jgi:hypothetical protein
MTYEDGEVIEEERRGEEDLVITVLVRTTTV